MAGAPNSALHGQRARTYTAVNASPGRRGLLKRFHVRYPSPLSHWGGAQRSRLHAQHPSGLAPKVGQRGPAHPHSPRPPKYAGSTPAHTWETRNLRVKMAALRSPSHQGRDRCRLGTC